MMSSNYSVLLWFLIVNCCCVPFTVQQFDFNGFPGGFPRPGNWLLPGQELVFATTPPNGNSNPASAVFVNNMPVNPTMPTFLPARTTPTPQFLQCFQRCQTTSEYNPICATNRQVYGNEQKFNCAKNCGADIQIVRRGSCEGLVQMQRG